uniref:Homeobox D13a n=2 Tax=Eptatretus TaxID=7763 RepID=A0A8C4Q3X5_EPTBU
MFVYDGSCLPDDFGKGAPRPVEGLGVANLAASPAPSRHLHSTIGGAAAPPFSSPEVAVQSTTDGLKQCPPCSGMQGPSALTALQGYGYPFGSGYYGCRVSPVQQGALKTCAGSGPGFANYALDKYMQDVSGYGAPEEYTARSKEFAFYPTHGAAYQPVPAGYLDVPVMTHGGAIAASHSDARHDPYQPWSIGGGWNGQVCCVKEQAHLWKGTLPDGAHHGDLGVFRRGRKKRVPYTKAQLKELEKEYATHKFITKDKRRNISANTGLSERQVTIWFQNRRVKEKKIVSKLKCSTHA